MIPFYEETSDHLQLIEQNSFHCPPHLHKSIEMIYVTKGSIVIGTGIDLFEMKEGDFAVVFPNLIHHYQVFNPGKNRHITLLASPSYFGTYETILQSSRPVSPVISKDNVHPDIPYALKRLMEVGGARAQEDGRYVENAWAERKRERNVPDDGRKKRRSGHRHRKEEPVNESEARMRYALDHGFFQVLLGRAMPALELRPRAEMKDQDIVYQTVAYVGEHYKEPITLTQMAADLGMSPFALSRVFSGVFHQNFNHYVNDVRLERVAAMLAETDEPITDIAYDCGFQSQATFNRVFQSKYHMTPRAYRNRAVAED